MCKHASARRVHARGGNTGAHSAEVADAAGDEDEDDDDCDELLLDARVGLLVCVCVGALGAQATHKPWGTRALVYEIDRVAVDVRNPR